MLPQQNIKNTKMFFQLLKLLGGTLSKKNNFVLNHTSIWYTNEEKMRYKIQQNNILKLFFIGPRVQSL